MAATSTGVYRVTDGADRVSPVGLTHLAVAEDGWWGIDDGGGLYRDGEEVVRLSEGRPNCVLPLEGRVLIGADRARLFVWDGERIEEDRAFASAPGREAWHTPWGGPPDVRSITADASGVVYVNVHVGGILRLDSAGVTPTVDIDYDVHQVLAHPTASGVVLAAAAIGLGVANDGARFIFRTEGLHARYCRAVAVTGDYLLVSASVGPRGGRAAVYRGSLSAGGGGRLTKCETGLPEWFDGNVDTHCLAVEGGAFFIGYGGTIWRSDDSAETWAVVADGLGRVSSLAPNA